ncbi:Similar to hypothetical protein [Tuber melanosporum Mel28]; acc. no. XP_002840925 [Pyronema omphalodes CBS 100304]|uniref:Sec20 C-terminal domain-containing protein n=1 Tax=Pyronema omphalodes (strain CBS 100304) TaxID=1076935 RepID=U4KXC5_PYROM|nr:Similar to hypothetical protein [Tuber melanosporum Mel28]; acc. no. XP_002840925 [Pyronema omphalodes CBS 100304]
MASDLLTISERLHALSDTHKEMSQIAVLSRSSTPQSELTDRLHHLLREAESEYASLLDDSGLSCPLGSSCTHAGAGHGTHSDSGISSLISKIGEDLKIARRQYRKALLQARQNSVQQQAQPKRITNEKVQQQDVVVAASSDVTAALRRTQQLMHAELQKSRFVTETLEESTEALKMLGDRYQAFDNMLGKSKELIRELVKKNKSDKWYYETAIKMLVGMFIWIIIRRLLWGPIILLIVWPVKMIWWTGGTVVGLAVGDKPRALSRLEFEAVGTTKMESMVTIQTQSIQAIPTAGVVQRVEPVRISPAPSQGAEEEEIRTMTEIVANIIDDSTTTILPNTRSRRVEDPPVEVPVQEQKSDAEPVAPATEEAVPQPIAATEVDEVELRDALNEAVRKQEATEVEEPSPEAEIEIEVEPTVERKHDEL